MTGRRRLTVLGGFLGAGKSTWLRHHLRSGVFEGACVVVNEAADTAVDDALLGQAGPLAVLAGGCACCERRSEMLALLRTVAGRPLDNNGPACGSIVFETSGLADPQAIVQAVRQDPLLATTMEIGEIVVLVDAPHGLDVLQREPLARRQVASADCLIVTKLDASEADTTARLLASLAVLNPAAPIFGAVRGVETALPPAADLRSALLLEPDQSDPAPLRAAEVRLGGADWSAFSLWLSALLFARGADIARVKGVVATPAGRLLVQGVQGAVQPAVVLPGPAAPDDGIVVVIGRGFSSHDLQRSFTRFIATCSA